MKRGKFRKFAGVFLLAGALLLTAHPMQARAQESGDIQREETEKSTTLTGTLGENNGLSWVFDGETQTLTMTGEDELDLERLPSGAYNGGGHS